MDNIRIVTDIQKVDSTDLIIYSNNELIYVTSKDSYNIYKGIKEDIIEVGKTVLQNMVINDDPRAPIMTKMGFEIKDNLLQSLLIITTANNSNIEGDNIVDIFGEITGDPNYFRRLLYKKGIEVPEKLVQRGLTAEEISRLIDENKKFKEKLRDIEEREDSLKRKELIIKNMLKEEVLKLKKEKNDILQEYKLREYKTNREFSKSKIDFPEGFRLPLEMVLREEDLERINIGGMEVTIDKQYRAEIESIVKDNPAVALEFTLCRLSYLLPYIYEKHDNL